MRRKGSGATVSASRFGHTGAVRTLRVVHVGALCKRREVGQLVRDFLVGVDDPPQPRRQEDDIHAPRDEILDVRDLFRRLPLRVSHDELHTALAAEILADQDAWCLVETPAAAPEGVFDTVGALGARAH